MANATPDVLFIVLDTLRRDRLSAYGHHRITSPAFDAFADDATRFDRAIAAAQWTIPSHASMFTGLYPSTHQLTQADAQLSPHVHTLPEILRQNGYHTAGFCNNPLVGVLETGLTRGFSEFYNYAGAAPNRPRDLTRGRVRRAVANRWRQFARRASQQFAQSDWLFRLSLHPWLTPLWTRAVNYKGNTQHAVDDMLDYLRAHHAGGRQQPLFAFLNLMGTHMPYRPPRDYLDRFAPEVGRDRDALRFMTRFNADAARWASPTDPPLSADERAVIDAFYDAEIAHQDYHLGRLLDGLRRDGKLDNTLVILVADHGEGHGDHNFFGHSFVVYQELVHVPLVIRYPAQFDNRAHVSANVSTRRLFHTVLDATGLHDALATKFPGTDARNLSLANVKQHPRADGGLVFAEAIPPHTFLHVLQQRAPALIDQLQLRQPRRGVYQGNYKLAVVNNHVEAMFDAANDPAERHDIAGQQRPLANSLHEQIKQFVQQAEGLRPDGASAGSVSGDMMDHLRALGYIE